MKYKTILLTASIININAFAMSSSAAAASATASSSTTKSSELAAAFATVTSSTATSSEGCDITPIWQLKTIRSIFYGEIVGEIEAINMPYIQRLTLKTTTQGPVGIIVAEDINNPDHA